MLPLNSTSRLIYHRIMFFFFSIVLNIGHDTSLYADSCLSHSCFTVLVSFTSWVTNAELNVCPAPQPTHFHVLFSGADSQLEDFLCMCQNGPRCCSGCMLDQDKTSMWPTCGPDSSGGVGGRWTLEDFLSCEDTYSWTHSFIHYWELCLFHKGILSQKLWAVPQ